GDSPGPLRAPRRLAGRQIRRPASQAARRLPLHCSATDLTDMAEIYEHQDKSREDEHALATRKLPEDVLITIPVRGMVLFPGLVLPVTIGGQRAAKAAQEAIRSERPVGLV